VKTLLRNRRGISVPEVVVATFCLVLMLTGLVGMTVNGLKQWSFGSSKLMADNDAVMAVQALSNEIRNGIRAYTDDPGTTLTVVLPLVNAQGDYDRFTEGFSVSYYVSNGKLWRKVGTDTATVLARKINSVTFAVDGAQVKVTTNSRQQYGTKVGDTTMTTQITLRNQPPQ
jgi:Tfp pilus assembly protein PilV